MRYLTDTAIEELKQVAVPVITMAKINWWLLKYADLHLEKKAEKPTFTCFDNLPCSCSTELPENKTRARFLNYYTELEKLSKIHEQEAYLETKLKAYRGLTNPNDAEVAQWYNRTEKLLKNELAAFSCIYLDYSDNSTHIKVLLHEDTDYDLFVDRDDFKSILEFQEVYSKINTLILSN